MQMEKKTGYLNDIELFEMLAKDKKTAEKAFAELYSRYSQRIYAYCRKILGDKEEARDIFQETFVKFFQSAKEERVMTNVPAFLLRIARNLCVNTKRKEKSSVSFEEYMVPASNTGNEKEEMLDLIRHAQELLPDEYKEAFVLREYEGLSYAEIGEITGANMSTVKVRIFRAKQKLRELLTPYLKEFSHFDD